MRRTPIVAALAAALFLAVSIANAPDGGGATVRPSVVATTASTTRSAPARSTSGSKNVYAAITNPMLAPAVQGIPTRVYVPDNDSNDVRVINPNTFKVVRTYRVGQEPQHITPAWNMRRLYVGNVSSNSLTVIDPKTALPLRTIPIPDPYNLYFTPNGRHAIDVSEGRDTLYFYDPSTWKLQGSVRIPYRGPDHLDFSRDGSYFLISTEYEGTVVKVGVRRRHVLGALALGGSTVDVKLAPFGHVFYVANQDRGGVSLIDPKGMRQVAFIRTGAGAHGFAIARDAVHLYVSNRLAGTISVIDTRTRKVVHTWHVGRSPDMLQVSADGRQLWASNRFNRSVSVISTRTGQVLHVIRVGIRPHGLTLFPQPGRFSLGHNGVYR